MIRVPMFGVLVHEASASVSRSEPTQPSGLLLNVAVELYGRSPLASAEPTPFASAQCVAS
jgi:hypothetical protein